jgi:hypothetical protein
MPLLVTLLPLIGLGFLASEPVEWALVAMSAVLGTSAICLGYREHRRRRALAIRESAWRYLCWDAWPKPENGANGACQY